MTILVTGGAGYIGSHTCIELLMAGHEVIVFDNFSNSHHKVIDRIQTITQKNLFLVEGDIRDQLLIEKTLKKYRCDSTIHFAGLKAVDQSVKNPLEYYENNFIGTYRLLLAMKNCGIKKIIFSSSATVYGEPQSLPIKENHILQPTNPYGRTKFFIEAMLNDLYTSDPDWRVGILRYFNPVGAHMSGLIGEDPKGIPNDLMPYLAQVAAGKLNYLNVLGNDYPTHDGTGVRDYIHVVDLAIGHIKALRSLDDTSYFTVNLGTGVGYSVLDVVKAFEDAAGLQINYKFSQRRPGDIAEYYADSKLANKILGWTATRDLDLMCSDHWRWQKMNPHGY